MNVPSVLPGRNLWSIKLGDRVTYDYAEDVEDQVEGFGVVLVGLVCPSSHADENMFRISVSLCGETTSFYSFEISHFAEPERVYVELGGVADAMLKGWTLAKEAS